VKRTVEVLRKSAAASAFLAALLTCPGLLFASATGLNNIPTADVVDEKTLVLQNWTDVGSNQVPEYFVGAKFSPFKNLEIGLDGKVGAASLSRGPVQFQAKYRFEFSEDWAAAAGFANLSGDSKRTGKVFPYAVVSGDLKWIRAHLGVEVQDDEEGPFAGVDRTFWWWEQHPTTLRADILPLNKRRDVLWSVGFIHQLTEHLLLEAWFNGSNDPERDESVTVKLDVVWPF